MWPRPDSRSRPCQLISSCARWANARSITATPLTCLLPLAWCGRQRSQGCWLEQLLYSMVRTCSRPCFMHTRIMLARSLSGTAAGILGHFYTFPGPVLWFRTCTDRARKPVGWNSRYAVKPFVDKAILSIFVPGLLKNHPALPTGWLESSHAGVKAVWPILNPSGLF